MRPKRSTRQNLQDLSTLTAILVSTDDLSRLHAKLTRQIARITGAQKCVIAEYDKNNTRFIATIPSRSKTGPLTIVYPVDKAKRKRWNFKTRGTLLSNKPLADPRLDTAFLKKYSIKNLILAPMLVRKEVIGLIALVNKKGRFTAFDAYLASLIAFQTGNIVVNARLRAEETRRANQISMLSEIISEIALMRDSGRILQTAVERIKQHFQYYFVAAAFVHESNGEAVIKNVFSIPAFEPDAANTEFVMPISQGLTGMAVRSGKTVIAPDVSASRHYFELLPEVRSEIAAPVKIGDRVVAVLDIESDKLDGFNEADRIIMETLANALGTAMENANAYARLEQINQQMEETSRMKEEIMQIVAHDFRSPLTVIRGYMDYLLRRQDWNDPQQKEIMETVSLQAVRLQNLAEATLKASRIDSGELSFNFEKTDFESFLNHLIFPWSERHSFIVKMGKNLPLVYTDPGRMQEVMENLLNNAIKYSPEGGKVTIRVNRVKSSELPDGLFEDSEQSFLQVSVTDEGVGIPADKRDLLFRRFTRIHDSRRIEGIGLGLYIAKKIIEAHGGRIWLKDQQHGACFCFALPEYKPEAKRENILLVDDDIHTLRLISKAIGELGFDVITAANGKEARDKLIRFKPAIIILDIIMPEMNGEELLHFLEEYPETRRIPYIVFTGKRDFELMENKAGSLIYKHQGIGALLLELKKTLNLG